VGASRSAEDRLLFCISRDWEPGTMGQLGCWSLREKQGVLIENADITKKGALSQMRRTKVKKLEV